MKRILIIAGMAMFSCIAHAQNPSANEKSWENNDNNHKAVYKQGNEFVNTEMSLREGEAIFSGLPEVSRPIWAIVTNAEGDFIKQMKISPQNNVMDVRSLHDGLLYFVTIMYKNKSKKAFTLNK